LRNQEGKVLRETTRPATKLAFALVLLFLIPMATPLIGSSNAQASGRASPDFSVIGMTFSGAGSVDPGTGISLEPAEHDVRVQVRNMGDVQGSASLQLVHKASQTSGEYIVTTIALGSLPALSTSNVIIIPWTAPIGDGQTLYARVTPSQGIQDSNPSNNEQRKDFDVENLDQGIETANSLPSFATGMFHVVIKNGMQYVNATVRNSGTKNISAVMELTLVNATNVKVTKWSNTQTLTTGSLFMAATSKNLSSSFDSTTFTGSGNWTMSAKVYFNGTSSSQFVDMENKDQLTLIPLQFSNFSATLTSLGDRSIEPGQTGTLTYQIKNTGALDSYKFISIVSNPLNRNWADQSLVDTTTQAISNGATISFSIGVTVPVGENRTNASMITIKLRATNGEYLLVTTVVAQAGESYMASIVMSSSVQKLLPGEMTTILFNVTNTGNVGGSFNFDCGLSVAARNWELTIGASPAQACSDVSGVYINRSVTATLALNIKVPPIQSPLDPGEFNLAGQALLVWIQVQAAGGGLPLQASQPIEVLPTIVVDPGLPSDEYVLSKEEVIAARNGQGLDEILQLNVEVRHNLFTNLDANLTAELTVSSMSFIAANSGGFSEASRWSSSLSPPQITGLKPGNTTPAVLSIQGPDDDYPLAGTLTLSVTVNPILGGVHTGSGVQASSVTQNLSVIIPSVYGAEINDLGPMDVVVGAETPVAFPFENTGNDLTSYRLRVIDTPDGWDVKFNGTDEFITNLSAEMQDFNSGGAQHIQNVVMLVTSDADARANSVVPVTVTIEELNTGEFITEYDMLFRVSELNNATLTNEQTQPITVGPTDTNQFTTLKITNTGNTPTTFYVYVETNENAEVLFELDSVSSMVIAAQRYEIIRVNVIPTGLASADQIYSAKVWVADATGAVNQSANISANITQTSNVRIEAPALVAVTPGEMSKIEFNVTNTGNLIESLKVTPTVEGDWSTDVTEIGMTLTINQTITGQIIVSVPDLGGAQLLMDGSIFNLSLSVYDATSNAYKTGIIVQLRIGALFDLEVEDWPDEMEFYRMGTRTWEVSLLNTGNRDVEVAVGYSINREDLSIGSSDWAMVDGAPTKIYLPVGVPITHIFSVAALKNQPDLSLTADFKIFYEPNNESVDGNASFATKLSMDRFFSTGDIVLRPEVGDAPLEVDLTYSHIPNGQDLNAAYELELCGATRLLEFAPLNLNEADYPWSFTVVVPDGTNTEIPLALDDVACMWGSQGSSSRISLPNRSAWDTTQPIKILVDAPNRPNILSGDGWGMTFRLYHPSENANYTVYDEETFTFALDVFADPMVESMEALSLDEGEEFDLLLTVVNAGTATTLGIDVALVCADATILGTPQTAENAPMIGLLGPGESMVLKWRIQPDSIDWWLQSIDSSCTATVDAFYWEKNVVGNDVQVIDLKVESTSPGVSTSFIALVVCFLSSLILLRLTSQNEKFRLFAVYSGVLGFGFAFHLIDAFYWGPAMIVFVALWIWRLSWTSTEEFKMIHEDYQRARRGVSTMYADHFDALRDSRRQLSVILAVPVLGFVAVVLGLPPQISNDKTNMVSVLVYIAVVMLGVWLIIRRADRAYGNLYGRLTDIEVKATRIERDLGDPARLFNELAGDGLNLEDIFGDVSGNATVGSMLSAEVPSEEVNDDA